MASWDSAPSGRPARPVTINDVARAAGVSRAAVSKVIRNALAEALKRH